MQKGPALPEHSVFKFTDPKAIISWLYALAVILLIMLAAASHGMDIPISRFVRDPMAIKTGHPLIGVLSNIGAILWSFSAAICWFAYFLLKKSHQSSSFTGFIFWGGVVSSVLLIDDFFMLHEMLEKYLKINEIIPLLFYGFLLVFYLIKYWRIIIATDYVYLALTLSFLAITFLTDRLSYDLFSWFYILEDGAKFLGIISWLGYQFSVCYKGLESSEAASAAPEPNPRVYV